MITRLFSLLSLTLGLVITSVALCHEPPHDPPKDDAVSSSTARGIVFDDRNGNGLRDPGEPGIPEIRVSNGAEIVATDNEGRFELSVDDDEIIFLIKPRDWATPLDGNNLPQFYYIHKPAGSPANFKFPGVDPTGPLPDSIDFPLRRRKEPDSFKAILFGDPQPRNVTEVEYMTHDVIEQILAEEAHGAAFGVTLGDIVFDDLSVMAPLNQAIALIGIPWYNVIGNHDLNLDAKSDDHSDETFERIYGPAYYSFDYGPTHFMVLDNVEWHGAGNGQKAHYHGGLGPRQIEFIRNDLARIPDDQLVVLMMHIPLSEVIDRQELYRLIEQRPAAVSISAHRHYMEHRLIGPEDGWKGPKRHHHIVNITVCGSWWRGQKDERGIPHATMSDGGPNGYSIMEFDGNNYSLELRAASRSSGYQMNIYAPEVVLEADLPRTVVMANVFNGSPRSDVTMRVGGRGNWTAMERITIQDPAFLAEKEREESLENRTWTDLPAAHATPHMWRAMLPAGIAAGTQLIEVRSVEPGGPTVTGKRIFRVAPNPQR